MISCNKKKHCFSAEHFANARLDIASTPGTRLRPQDIRRSPGRQPERHLPRISAPLPLLRLHGLPAHPVGRRGDVREANPLRARTLLDPLLVPQLVLVSGHMVRDIFISC